MKFTFSWLKDHLDTQASAPAIADALTHVGLELESLSNPAEALKPFRIASVVEARPHPNADRLRVCTVDVGAGEPVQVVCGAPNARSGMKGVFAPPGTRIPGTGLDLKPGVIRGVESNGMLCSERELLLSDEHEGIMDLPEDAPVGESYAAWAGLDDPVIDVGVTPNRPDALGVRGIARDLAAKGIGTLRPLDLSPVRGAFDSPVQVSLRFSDDDSPCPLFVGRYVRGVKNGPSPDWLQRRLRAIGLRPISALVDITNFVTHDLARPLHVFDADKLTGDVHARLARNGESLKALDGRSYDLDDSMTVIADESGPLGIAGIIGGEATGVTEETVDVFLEAAYFDPVRTAATGRRLGVQSDARYRFERGVDPAFVEPGAEIATRLVLELCGGEASGLVVAGSPPLRRITLPLRFERVRTLGGIEIPPPEQARILTALGFHVEGEGAEIRVEPPSWRPDINGEADLVEEILRIHGLEKVENLALPRIEVVTSRKVSTAQRRRFLTARTLASRGLNEAVTWSFIPAAQAELFGGGASALKLDNPISSELTDMRPSLLPGLLTAAGRNRARGIARVSLCEVGQVYFGDRPQDERLHASGLRVGATGPRHWAQAPRPADVFDVKADALALLEALGAPVDKLQTVAGGPDWYHPGRAGAFMLGPKVRLATFGEIHPRVLEALDLEGPVGAFEVDLDAIPQPRAGRTARGPLRASDFPAVSRDFAFVVDEDVAATTIVRAAESAEKNLIERVAIFDVFRGPAIGEGRKSVALEVTLRPRERTLTEDEIEAAAGRIRAAVERATGGTLRS